MREGKMIAEPWLSFLRELDELADGPVRLDCMGGFVVTMLYGLERATGDVDYLEIAPKGAAKAFQSAMKGGALHRKHGI